MKKRFLSLMLVLSLVLGTFIPVFASETSPQEELFNTLVAKFASLKNAQDALKLLDLVEALDNKDALMQNIESALEDDVEAKNILINNGITKEVIADFMATIRSLMPSSENIKEDNTMFLVKLLFDENPKYSNYASNLNDLATELYEKVPQEVKDDLGRYADSKQGKIDFLSRFINAFLDSQIGTATYDVSLKKYTAIDLKVPANFKEEANRLLANPLEGQTKITLTDNHINSIDSLINVIESQIKDAGKLDAAGYILVKTRLVKEIKVNEPTKPTDPSDPGTGGGGTGGGGGGAGGGGGSTSKEEATIPTDPQKPVTIEIDQESIKVEVKDGISTVTVDEKVLMDAVKKVAELAKKAGEGRKAEIVLLIKDVKDANLNVVLSSDIAYAFKNLNVNLVIKSNFIEYYVPAGLLSGVNLPEEATIELKSKEVDVSTVAELKQIVGDTKKVVELSLVIVYSDGTEKEVTEFSAYLTVKLNVKGLGDPDKLVIYYINEENRELEFVSGKVKDSMLIMNINHFSKYAIVERNISFVDTTSHWAKKYIESMAAKHIIDGVGDGTFKPNDKVTRAQFVKLLVGALGFEELKYNGEFKDVKADEWFADYVATAVANGLTDGYVDGTFRPNQEISRAEMAVMLSRVLKDVKVDYIEEYNNVTKFADGKDVGDWAKKGVAAVVKADLMQGVDGNRFAPNATTSRAEAATVVYRLFNR